SVLRTTAVVVAKSECKDVGLFSLFQIITQKKFRFITNSLNINWKKSGIIFHHSKIKKDLTK
ncbi:hypothetical protein, partial [Aquirufa aurantiipilula]